MNKYPGKNPSLVNAFQQAALLTDADSTLVLAGNSTAANLFGYEIQQLEQLKLTDLFGEQWPVLLSSSGENNLLNIAAHKNNGETVPVSIYRSTTRQHDQAYPLLLINPNLRTNLETTTAEQIFSTVFYAHPDSVTITRLADGQITHVNKGFEKITGYTQDEVVGRSTLEIGLWPSPQDRQRVIDQLRQHGSFETLPITLKIKSGEYRDCLISADVIELNDAACIIAITRDVTAQKHAELELLKSEAVLRKAQEIAQMGSWSWDLSSNAVGWSDTLYTIYGVDRESYSGPLWAVIDQTIHPDDQASLDQIVEVISSQTSKKWDIEYRIHRLDTGEERYLWGNGEIVYDQGGKAAKAIGIVQDITERKHTEQLLHDIASSISSSTGDEFFRNLVEKTATTFGADYCFVGVLDSPDTPTQITTAEMYSKGEFVDNFNYELTNTPCAEVVSSSVCAVPSNVQALFPKDAMLQEMGIESYLGTALYDSAGEVLGIYVMLHSQAMEDIETATSVLQIFAVRAAAELERIRSEKALRSSEEQLRLALTGSNIGTWDWDIASNSVIWSSNVESILRMSPGSFSGTYAAFLDVLHPEDRPRVEAAIADVLAHVKPYFVEFRIVAPSGDIYWTATRGEVHRNDQGVPVRMTGTVLDITPQRNAEQSLIASRKILRLVLDTIPARVFWKDRESHYMGCNQLFATDLGLRNHHDLIGQSDHDLIPEEWAALYESHDQEVMSSGKAKLNYSVKVPRRDGGEAWLELSKVPLTDGDGQIIGVLGTYNDVTAEKQAQVAQRHSQKKLELHFMQTPLALIEWDVDFKVTDWNPAATRIFGYTKAEAMGRAALDLIIPEAAKPHVDKVWQTLLENRGGKRSTNANVTKSGKEIICEWYNTSLVDDNGVVVGVASAAEDITQRIHAENKLSNYRNHLEDEVKARTEELMRVNKEMEAFSYSVSHDLRSPLRAIDGYSHMLLDDYADAFDADGRQTLERVRSNAQQMSRLIDDLLKLSRLTRGELQHEHIDLTKLAQEINHKLQDEHQDRTVHVEIQQGLSCSADEGLLRVVLTNLFDNAWKYTAKIPRAEISFGATQNLNETEYCIADNGAGFSMEYVDKLFGAFQRLHRGDDFAGTGIGLATVARIIHRHQGRVWAEGKEQHGARFYFSLPHPAAEQ